MRVRRARRVGAALGLCLLLCGDVPGEEPQADGPRLVLELEPQAGTVGDRLSLQILVDLPSTMLLEPTELGPSLGPFSLSDGSWIGPQAEQGRSRWTFRGNLVSYRTGDLELPPIRLRVTSSSGTTTTVESEPRRITIRSVLEPGSEDAELADLKPPTTIAPRYGALLGALGVLLLLLAASGVLWWLHRRYAARLAAVPVPDDPFHRTPPHVWVYAELQRLLEQRLAEAGRFELFYSELSRILKRYLSGRFRVELMERTTDELSSSLAQASAPPDAIASVVALLRQCDLVKFAQEPAQSTDCRAAIEQAYRIVDVTKPDAAPETAAEQGAA